ncbi:MAG: hypothetical protein O3A65_07695 [Proteobacteria bacterium]|nr:hypothetical protein [Pseudomonadota bacterium]
MKSKHIPANREAAQKAEEMVKVQIAALTKSTSTKKRASLQDKLNKERLQGLQFTDSLIEDAMGNFGRLLEPKQRAKIIKKRSLILSKLNKKELTEKLAEAELDLQIERGFAGVANRVNDYLWHEIDGDEYKKIKSSENRQLGRQAIFAEDETRLHECLKEVRKRKGVPLVSEDYGVFRREVYLRYPQSRLKQAPRLTGEYKDRTFEQQEKERGYMREDADGWNDGRLRGFFEKYAKVKAIKTNF